MRVLISDTSVFRDLERGRLLDAVFQLPYELCTPDILFARELAGDLGSRLVNLGLEVAELSPSELARAARLRREAKDLSTCDTFALSLAETRGWKLVTGAKTLKDIASVNGLIAYDVLWVIEELNATDAIDSSALRAALKATGEHPRCKLAGGEIQRVLSQLE